MKLALLCFTRQGLMTCQQIASCFSDQECSIYAGQHIADGSVCSFSSVYHCTATLFPKVDALVFVGACGIAVRAIAPLVQSKYQDPAVLVVDELGQFVISLLSGHVGGANRLARQVAEQLGAQPIITTATDLQHQFAVDIFAKEHHLRLTDQSLAKEISAAFLHGVPVGLQSTMPIPGDTSCFAAQAELGIWIGEKKASPFSKTLWLQPQDWVLGIGCKKGSLMEPIEAAVQTVLAQAELSIQQIRYAATIDRKAEEPGLLAFCKENDLPLRCYTAETLQHVEGEFHGSDFVAKTVGVDNVCERAAVCGGNELRIPKTARDGVTVALAKIPL